MVRHCITTSDQFPSRFYLAGFPLYSLASRLHAYKNQRTSVRTVSVVSFYTTDEVVEAKNGLFDTTNGLKIDELYRER